MSALKYIEFTLIVEQRKTDSDIVTQFFILAMQIICVGIAMTWLIDNGVFQLLFVLFVCLFFTFLVFLSHISLF